MVIVIRSIKELKDFKLFQFKRMKLSQSAVRIGECVLQSPEPEFHHRQPEEKAAQMPGPCN